ncbi:MAG: SDR family NAD(P)-dependent oxidoreductase, partial [Sphingobacteriales bacterium]
MKHFQKEATSLAHKTVVIVGASSGIGRAAALAFAAENCNLVLASRRNAVLAELAVECESLGGKATHKVTDVTDAEAVKSLCEYAIATFGHIDVWINNAGAGVMGTYEDIPTEVHDQVVKVSLLEHMYGAHAVLPHFKERKKGTLINTISIGAFIPETYGVAYSASKYGLRGYSEALRAELGSWRDIHICDVFPSYIDTPGFEHAGNYTGKKL